MALAGYKLKEKSLEYRDKAHKNNDIGYIKTLPLLFIFTLYNRRMKNSPGRFFQVKLMLKAKLEENFRQSLRAKGFMFHYDI